MKAGLYELLEEMQRRLGAGESELLKAEEVGLFVELFHDVWKELDAFLEKKLGSESKAQTASILWEWFLEDTSGKKEAIWVKAWRSLQWEQSDLRDRKARAYLKKSASRWLIKRLGGSDTIFYRRVMDALRDEAFALSGGTEEAATYTLRGRSFPEDPSFDAGAFGRRLPRRSFKNRSGDHGQSGRTPVRVPDASDIRDALIDAMEQAKRAFTVDQAEAAMRWVFGVSFETEVETLDDPERPPTLSNFEEVKGRPDPFTEDLPFYFAKEAADAVIAEVERQDKMLATERPADTSKGRVARYLLDFELWDGWPLLWHPDLEAISAKVPTGKRKIVLFDSIYDLTLFEAWSGIPDSSVSDWRAARRWELLALGLAAGLGWSKPKALNYLAPDRCPEERRNHPEARRLLTRLLFHLRARFLHRKPHFVSPEPFTRETEEASEIE